MYVLVPCFGYLLKQDDMESAGKEINLICGRVEPVLLSGLDSGNKPTIL